ncbi:MAG: peptidase M14 family protein [Gemmatimonadota bacterium]|nr:MAG: peptidase M14 family protein [Gemmatimonadota bacterium]
MSSIRRLVGLACLLVLTIVLPATILGQQIPSPESFFGFQMGADRKLARWDKMVEYYDLVGERSPRVHVVHMGPSTLGNPFLVLFISAPDNLARLEQLKQLNAILSDPRGVPEADIERAISEGKAVVVQSMGLHSSEVAASQMAVEVTYDMATRNDGEMLRILDNTIAIMIPCFNPDGEIMITDWYDQWIGTEYEGVSMPWLYHHYIGHDNNRDAFMQNTIESFYGAEIMFREWVPQAYVDHHQMGAYGARLYVPPYAEPIRPDGDPLVWREMSWYGAHIAYKEEEAGISGVVNAAIYSGWGHFGFHWITPFHNIAGMLTESASARLATPIFLHPDQLQGSRRGMPEYEPQTTFPNPWPGGWWRVRDIVEQQKVATIAVLDIAARNRETVLRNAYLKATRQVERGAAGKPAAFVIPATQHDPLTMQKMVNKLLGQGIEVHQSTNGFSHEDRIYSAGTYVVSLAQPKRGVIRWLLGRTFYPDNDYTRSRDGSPMRPYDMSTDNIAEYMGVRVDPVDTWVEADLAVVADTIDPSGQVRQGQYGYVMNGRLNDSFKAANLLWQEGVALRRIFESTEGLRPGDFIVPSTTSEALIAQVADQTGVDFNALDTDASPVSSPVTQPRLGMYQRYFGGNMDEGWTRLLLERFEFPYSSILDEELRDGNLNRNYDVIILPDDNVGAMTGESRGGDGGGGYFATGRDAYPPEYRSGFGQPGVDALEAFVANGGTLVTFARASGLPIEEFGLPIRNVVEGVPSTEFWSPGSTLRMNVDNTNAIGYGMPEEAVGLFLQGNHAYQVTPSARNEATERIATFVERDIMLSGWLIGEHHIAEKAAVVSVGYGQGKIVLIGFRAQHRVQTHGTFKFVFNALVDAAAGRQ